MTPNETAVIVGGAGGIGRFIVERLIQAGLDVLVVGRDRAALDDIAAHHKVRICTADIAREESSAAIGAMLTARCAW